MANQKATQVTIPLAASLNCNKNNTDIKNFNGFNENNSPIYGGNLSNFWTKENSNENDKQHVIDFNGNDYTVRKIDENTNNYGLYKNDELVLDLSNRFLVKDEIEDANLIDIATSTNGEITARLHSTPNGLVFSANNTSVTKTITQTGIQSTSIIYINQLDDHALLYVYASNGLLNLTIHLLKTNETLTTSTGLSALNEPFITAKYINATDGIEDALILFSVFNGVISDVTPFTGAFSLLNRTYITVSYTITGILNGRQYPSYYLTAYGTYFASIRNLPFFNSYSPCILEFRPTSYVLTNGNVEIQGQSTRCWNPDLYGGSYQQGFYCNGHSTVSTIGPYGTEQVPEDNANLSWFTIDNNADVSVYPVIDNCGYTHTIKNPDPLGDGVELKLNFSGIKKTLKITHSTYSGFNVLMNNGVNSGISYGYLSSGSAGNRGVSNGILCTEWFDVMTNYVIKPFSSTSGSESGLGGVYYKNSKGQIIRLRCLGATADRYPEIKLYNGMIITNSTARLNAYKVDTNEGVSFANDWNSRISFGSRSSSPSHAITSGELSVSKKNFQIASAINPNIEVTEWSISSILLNPLPCYKIKVRTKAGGEDPVDYPETYTSGLNSNTLPILNNNRVALYSNWTGYGEPDTQAVTYRYSWASQTSTFYDSELNGLLYPVETNGNILYSPNIFSKYLSSYTNQDMIQNGDISYPLLYVNNKQFFLYYLLSMVDGLTDSFVIQGQYYGITKNRLLALDYNNGTINNVITILSTEGLKFIGASSRQAFFFCEANNTIYSFAGDRLMTMEIEANRIKEIYNFSYNPATEYIYLSTNDGIYVINAVNMFRLNKQAEEIFITNKGFALTYGNTATFYNFRKDDDLVREPVKFTTSFYGVGNNQVSIVDCLYLRLFSESPSDGELKLKVYTLTDKGSESEEKTFFVKEKDWDKITNTLYLRYQPGHQRGVGISFEVTSDFPVSLMSTSVLQDTTVQNSGLNI